MIRVFLLNYPGMISRIIDFELRRYHEENSGFFLYSVQSARKSAPFFATDQLVGHLCTEHLTRVTSPWRIWGETRWKEYMKRKSKKEKSLRWKRLKQSVQWLACCSTHKTQLSSFLKDYSFLVKLKMTTWMFSMFTVLSLLTSAFGFHFDKDSSNAKLLPDPQKHRSNVMWR